MLLLVLLVSLLIFVAFHLRNTSVQPFAETRTREEREESPTIRGNEDKGRKGRKQEGVTKRREVRKGRKEERRKREKCHAWLSFRE